MENTSTGKNIQSLLTSGYNFDSGKYINLGFATVMKDLWTFVGFQLLYFLMLAAASFIPFGSVIIQAVIGFGISIVAIKILRKEEYVFGDFFKGFDKFGPLFLTQMLIVLIAVACAIPFIVATFIFGFSVFNFDSGFQSGFFLYLIPIFLLMAVVFIYIGVSYVFAPYLAFFRGLSPWEAMETSRKIISKKFWSYLGFFILLGLINILGAICCFIGLIVTYPATRAAISAAFEDIIGTDLDLKDERIINEENTGEEY